MKYALMLWLLPWSSLVLADTPTENLQQKLNVLQAFTANFSQVVKVSGRVIQRSKGKVAILRPGKFRWFTRQPMEQLIVADGKKLWVFDKELEQVTVKSQKKGLGGTPALFLSGYDDSLSRDYSVSFQKKTKKATYQLLPKNPEGTFKKVVLVYVGDTLTRIELLDKLGQTTLVKFTRIRMNPQLKARLFQFKPPKGVDVIDA